MKTQEIFLAQMITFVLTTALASAQSHLPPDPDQTCTVTQATINGWFVGGKVVKNGPVNPADSVNFPVINTTCDFYKWSSQMFLWLTSTSMAYSATTPVFDSPVFFDVSPPVNGKRTLIPNTEFNIFHLRSAKPEEIGETGQAGGGGVLISQAGSLLYYGIHVNDVYAYFLTGQKGGKIPGNAFPTTEQDLKAVESFAGKNFADGEALAIEVKTSWVDASTIGDKSRFITIRAAVPKYDPKTPTKWTVSATENKELALVGMHVVGSAQGHPEMIWATFEHVDNSPDNAYFYTNSRKQTVQVPYCSQGKWLLMATGGSMSPPNVEYMSVDSSGNIVAKTGHTIKASNSFRVSPWGSGASNSPPFITNNTLLISINNSVLSFLADGDVRKNYILHGAIWTQLGKIPPLGTQKGSLDLANTTMETYHQNLNCFTCHSGSSSIGLSHIYSEIQPLPRPQPLPPP